MPKDKLTKRQVEILSAIEEFITNKGYSPSFREIGTMVQLSSSSTVHGYMERLKQEGYITWKPGQPRTIKILKMQITAS